MKTIWLKLGMLHRCRPFLVLAFAFLVQDAAAGQEVKVTVVSIVATDLDTHIHPKIRHIARKVQEIIKTDKELQKLTGFKKLTGFRLKRITSEMIKVKVSRDLITVDDQKIKVMILEHNCPDGKVRLKVKPPSLGTVVYRTECGKCFPIVTGYVTRTKKLLILGVIVNRCNANDKDNGRGPCCSGQAAPLLPPNPFQRLGSHGANRRVVVDRFQKR